MSKKLSTCFLKNPKLKKDNVEIFILNKKIMMFLYKT